MAKIKTLLFTVTLAGLPRMASAYCYGSHCYDGQLPDPMIPSM